MKKTQKVKIEQEFENFANRNFESPNNCKNTGQVEFYIKELYSKIEELSVRFEYVPLAAFRLLGRYNLMQNKLN